jgi:putative restriction endonuclease
LLPRVGIIEPTAFFPEERAPFEVEGARERVAMLVSRIVRDRVFRRIVLRAYDERCAVTGLKLINGGGRAEVEAAHIRPVEANGPDIVSNGLALSGPRIGCSIAVSSGLMATCVSSFRARRMIRTA